MKKFIIPMMLGIVTVGALTSCNNTPTQNYNDNNYNIINVKRANEETKPNYRVVTKINDEDLHHIKNTTASELGLDISKKYSIPEWDDFDNANSFEYMGYSYTVTDTDGNTTMKKSGYATNASTVEVVYAGSIDGTNGFTHNFTSFSNFTNAKTVIDVMQISSTLNSMPKLETVYVGSSCIINNQLKSTIKHFVFTCDPTNLEGLKYLSEDTKIIAPSSIAANIRKKMDICYNSEKDYMEEIPTLYVIPDEELIYQSEEFKEVYEVGGIYITAPSSNGHGMSLIGDKATKVVADLSVFDNYSKRITFNYVTRTEDVEKTHVEEMYFTYPKTTTQDLFSAFDVDKLYLGSIGSEFWSGTYDGAKEVYFPEDIDTGFSSVHLNNGENIALTTFYFPDTEKDNPTLYANVIQELSKNSKAKFDYYDASSYTPTMEVEVNGVRKSTTDMTVSYSELVQEALNSTGEEIGDVNQDEMTEEEREKLARDQEAADPVIASISEIGEVTLESKDAINEVKAAYEELTYDQQQLVTNKEDLVNAITTYNELVAEFNENLEEGQEALQTIADLKDKTKVDDFFEGIKESKALIAVTVLLGTALGGFLIYGLYKLISKFVKWVKR